MSRLLFFRKPSHTKASLKIIDVASTILSKAELKKGVVLLHCRKCGDTTRHQMLEGDGTKRRARTKGNSPWDVVQAVCLTPGCGRVYTLKPYGLRGRSGKGRYGNKSPLFTV